ncbi:MAG TPA: alpha/beta hydrolase [Archangium sp.]|uniref:alpha/beta fold hydrolase n=1 Tax=Archangium sp. TaxID=1872627 RepID=UPI002E32CD80|nr:alpha/beta hydrolase [Archangium sp.]HEX5749975.1 alpha/beta hydrolase [Archangium sp.]
MNFPSKVHLLAPLLALLTASSLGCGEEVTQPEQPQPAPAPAGFRHETAQVNGLTLHYVRGGAGAPLVLLHGWPETWYEWHRVMPSLAERYTVIVPDLRGAGESSKPAEGYTKKQMAEDIYQLVRQIGFVDQPIHLVGHDIGMMVAYAYAAQYPQAVSKLVLMDAPLPGIQPFWDFILLDPRSWHFDFHAEVELAEAMVKGQEREYLQSFYQKFALNKTAFTEEELREATRAYSQPGALAAGFKWYMTFPLDVQDNQLFAQRKLTMPVLALGGEASAGPFMVPMVQQVAENVTGGAIPQSGHWIAQEQPEELVRRLKDFLQ